MTNESTPASQKMKYPNECDQCDGTHQHRADCPYVKSTPASQLSTALDRTDYSTRVVHTNTAAMPSPARSDMLGAERGLAAAYKAQRDNLLAFIQNAPVDSGVCCCGDSMDKHYSQDHSAVDMWDHSVLCYAEEFAKFDATQGTPTGMAESAPSRDSIATWQERMGPGYIDGGADLPEEVAMKDEIADLRAALARRATAAPSGEAIDPWNAALDASIEEIGNLCKVIVDDEDTQYAALQTAMKRLRAIKHRARRATAGTAAPAPEKGKEASTHPVEKYAANRWRSPHD